jgi:hypothetical protein
MEKNIIIFFDILQIDDVSTTTIKKNKIHSKFLKRLRENPKGSNP